MKVDIEKLREQIENLLQAVTCLTLDRPEAVVISVVASRRTLVVHIKVSDRSECARLIGSGGESIKSIRRLILNGARRYHIHNVVVDIIDPTGRGSGRSARAEMEDV